MSIRWIEESSTYKRRRINRITEAFPLVRKLLRICSERNRWTTQTSSSWLEINIVISIENSNCTTSTTGSNNPPSSPSYGEKRKRSRLKRILNPISHMCETNSSREKTWEILLESASDTICQTWQHKCWDPSLTSHAHGFTRRLNSGLLKTSVHTFLL